MNPERTCIIRILLEAEDQNKKWGIVTTKENEVSTDYLSIPLELNGREIRIKLPAEEMDEYMDFQIDTGACRSILKIEKLDCKRINFANRIALGGILNRKDEYVTHGEMTMTIFANGEIFPHEFQIIDNTMNLDADGIIGADFLLRYECQINYEKGRFLIPLGRNRDDKVDENRKEKAENTRAIVHTENTDETVKTVLPEREAGGETFRINRISARSEGVVEVPCNWKAEVVCEKQEIRRGVFIGNTISKPENGMVKVSVLNTNEKNIELGVEVENIKYMPLSEFDIVDDRELTRLDGGTNEIEGMIDLSLCNNEERKSILAICKEFGNIFYMPGEVLGCTNNVKHRIQVGTGQAPINVKPYRLPQTHKLEVDKQIREMLKDRIIQPSDSPWNAPLLLVPKKAGPDGVKKWRVVVDFRELNKATIKDAFPIPNITDILDQLGKSNYFSCLDLASGYHQVQMDPRDAEKTAFSSYFQHYEFTRMCFGLTNAPATFQRLMNNVLSGLQGMKCFVYIDDVIVYGKTLADHNNKLREIFERLSDNNLKLKLEKCHFLRKEITYLGHKISSNVVTPDAEKVKSVFEYAVPKTHKQIKNESNKNNERQNTPAKRYSITCEKSADKIETNHNPNNGEIKNEISVNINKIGMVETRARVKQIQKKADSDSQSRASEKKRKTTIAKYYLNEERINKLRKKNYDVMVYVIDNEENARDKPYYNADAFSKEIGELVEHNKSQYLVFLPSECGDDTNRMNIQKCVENIHDLCERKSSKRVAVIMNKYAPEFYFALYEKIERLIAEGRRYVTIFFDEVIELKQQKDIERIVRLYHDSPIGGHLGVKHTLDRLKLKYKWKNMMETVSSYIEKSDKCQRNKITVHTKMPLKVTSTAKEPFEKISMDIVGPIQVSEKGHKYILTIMDDLTKYAEAVPIKNADSFTVAEAFVTNFVCRHALPKILLTDNGSNFISQMFEGVCKLLKIKHIRTAVYRPQSNGQIERWHRSLAQYIRAYTENELTRWCEWLPYALFVHNTTPHSATKYTPHELVYGVKAEIPTNIKSVEKITYNYDDYANLLRNRIYHANKIARDNTMREKEQRKGEFDKTANWYNWYICKK